jgi:hypothetical protein
MTAKTICICSDSQAVLFALSKHTVSSRLVLQCRNSLQGLSIHNRVQLFWVPGQSGHCGIIGNEEADSRAGVVSKSSFSGPKPCLPAPKSLMTRVKKESFLLETGKRMLAIQSLDKTAIFETG